MSIRRRVAGYSLRASRSSAASARRGAGHGRNGMRGIRQRDRVTRGGRNGQADSMTLAGVIDDLARRGYGEQFYVAGGRLRGLRAGQTFSPESVVIREHHRFEGVSDPDDMAIVYAIECADGVRGTLADAFGVYADPAVGAVLERIPIRLKAG